jgi:hypothetical protein
VTAELVTLDEACLKARLHGPRAAVLYLPDEGTVVIVEFESGDA